MRITVLGKSPAWQDADGACSGYLVEGGGLRVLVDCGPGALAKLRRYADHRAIDAVVITHLHADHILDLVTYASALRYGPGAQPPPRPRLIAPPGAREAFAGLDAAVGMRADHIDGAFALTVYDPAAELELGGLRLRFCPVPHWIPANAVELAEDGARFTFSSDCGPNDALVEFAAGTDLLLIEATLPEPEPDGVRGHLTPYEAGQHGARAAARRVVLTHYTDDLEPAWVEAEGARGFGGPVDAAREGDVYAV